MNTPSRRKPWHGEAGRPRRPKKTIEDVLNALDQTRKFIDGYRRPNTKTEFYTYNIGKLADSKTTFNNYLEYGGIPHPFPPQSHLVYAVDATTGRLLWVSDRVVEVIGVPRKDLVGKIISEALCGGRDLRAEASEIFAVAQRLRSGESEVEDLSFELVRVDGTVVPVDLTITYGHVYDSFFVDAVVDERMLQNDHESAINTQPYVLTLQRQDLADVGEGEGKTNAFFKLLYKTPGHLAASMFVSYGVLSAHGQIGHTMHLLGCSMHHLLGG